WHHLCTDSYYHASHHQPTENAPEQQPVLEDPWNREVIEEHRDDEDVVSTQRELDQIPGDEFQHCRSSVVHAALRPRGTALDRIGRETHPEPVLVVPDVDHPRKRECCYDPD